MLSEEANEFFTAETLVDRLDAWADFTFVAIATISKHMASKAMCLDDLGEGNREFECLSKYISRIQQQMTVILQEEMEMIYPAVNTPFATYTDKTLFEKILDIALLIVIEANEQKGTEKNAAGKIIKPEGFVKPEARLEVMLQDNLPNYKGELHGN